MASYKVKPSKPMAVFGALFGAAMLVVVLVTGFVRNSAFLWLWVAGCVAIIGFNLWAAFSKRGATEVVEHHSEG